MLPWTEEQGRRRPVAARTPPIPKTPHSPNFSQFPKLSPLLWLLPEFLWEFTNHSQFPEHPPAPRVAPAAPRCAGVFPAVPKPAPVRRTSAVPGISSFNSQNVFWYQSSSSSQSSLWLWAWLLHPCSPAASPSSHPTPSHLRCPRCSQNSPLDPSPLQSP